METNIYYQLAQTEYALDRCKARLFKKNLTIVGLLGVVYILGKAGVQQIEKAIDARKECDAAVEEKEKALEELRQMKREDEKKTTCCDGYATVFDPKAGRKLDSVANSVEKLKND